VSAAQELELAITHLLRARELAQFFGHPEEMVKRIDLVKRATAKVRAQLMAGKQAA
jgi:hypothetical protein